MTHTHTWRRYGLFEGRTGRDLRYPIPCALDRWLPTPWYTGWQCVSCGEQGYAA